MRRKTLPVLLILFAFLFMIPSHAVEYKDRADIDPDYAGYVDFLTKLNIIVGDDKGFFNPKSPIKRCEAAKMIYVLRNRGVADGAARFRGMKAFSDVPEGSWYEGYVNYCYSYGIIVGMGAGRFEPDGQLTAVQLARMLLVCSGFSDAAERDGVTPWNVIIINAASQSGIFTGLDMDYNSPISRQQACLMFYNCLNSYYLKYVDGERMSTSETVGHRYFGIKTAEGALVKTGGASLGGVVRPDGKSTVRTAAGDIELSYTCDQSLLGSKVRVSFSEKTGEVYLFGPIGETRWQSSDISVSSSPQSEKLSFDDAQFTYQAGESVTAYSAFLEPQVFTACGEQPLSLAIGAGQSFVMTDSDADGKPDLFFCESVEYALVKEINAVDGLFSAGRLSTLTPDEYAGIVFEDSVDVGCVAKITYDHVSGKRTVSLVQGKTVGYLMMRTDKKVIFEWESFDICSVTAEGFTPDELGYSKRYWAAYDDGRLIYVLPSDQAPEPVRAEVGAVTKIEDREDGIYVTLTDVSGRTAVYPYAAASWRDVASPGEGYEGAAVSYVLHSGSVSFRSSLESAGGYELFTCDDDISYDSLNGILIAGARPFAADPDTRIIMITEKQGGLYAEKTDPALMPDLSSGRLIYALYSTVNNIDRLKLVILASAVEPAKSETRSFYVASSELTYGYNPASGQNCFFSSGIDRTGYEQKLAIPLDSAVRPEKGGLYAYTVQDDQTVRVFGFDDEQAEYFGMRTGVIVSLQDGVLTVGTARFTVSAQTVAVLVSAGEVSAISPDALESKAGCEASFTADVFGRVSFIIIKE